jgi:UDP-glucose 4-epimerase
MMSVALVTGGAGFVGGHLTKRLLSEGFDVLVLDDLSTGKPENVPAEARLTVGSVLDLSLVGSLINQADEIYHLAAIASVERCNREFLYSHAVNVTAFLGILDAVRSKPIAPALIYASSAAVYGHQEAFPTTERSPKQPLSAYGADKFGCELHAHAMFESFGLGSVGLRFFNVYGQGQDPSSPYSGVISRFIHSINNEGWVGIHGDGLQTRDFVHVSDVVTAMRLVAKLQTSSAEVFNVCTGVETTIRGLAEVLTDVLGKPTEITYGPGRVGDIRRSVGSADALKERVGFQARYSLADGLRRDFAPQRGLT